MPIEWQNVLTVVLKGALPYPQSCISGIKRVAPVNWDWRDVPPPKPTKASMLESIESTVRKIIRENGIKRVGVWVSGGIDSSALLAVAARVVGSRNVAAYTLRYEKGSAMDTADETVYAKQIAEHVGCKIYIEPMTVKDHLRLLKDAQRNEVAGGPITNSGSVLKVARMCQQHGEKHVFSALGLDELCGGYPPHAKASDADFPQVELFHYQFCNYHYAWLNRAQTAGLGYQFYFPYLDKDLVSIFRGYPRQYKTRGLETKVKVRDELHKTDLVPPEIIERGRIAGTKGGFTPMVQDWWVHGLKDWAEENLPIAWKILGGNLSSSQRRQLWVKRHVRRLDRRNLWFAWRLASLVEFKKAADELS